MALSNLQKDRLKKLKNIEGLGIDPYPAKANRKQTTADSRKMLGKKVAVAGRLRSLRPHGKITFADLEDESGKIQLFFSQTELPDKYDFLSNVDLGDFIQAEGEIFKTQAGEITIRVSSYQLLTKSLRPLPSSWYGLKDVEERYRQRYVDLIINPEVKKVMDTRHKVTRFLRKFMEEKGFVEVETPTLQPIYGGATAKPFTTHHNVLDSDLYLRIADELYLKRLIVGGYEKVFEICKDFRNEGVDRQHSPEFTMMEFYWAYANYNDLMNLTEEMISQLVKEIYGGYKFEYEDVKLDFKPPFKRIEFNELLKEYSEIDLDKIKTEQELLHAIKEKGIKLDLDGVVGFGPLVDELYKKVARPKLEQPTLLINYPSSMKPLSKEVEENHQKSASYQLVVMGYEIINAYNELNDPIEQEKRWREQMDLAKAGLEEHQVLDEDYIQALEYGMPPTAGFGMGIDRLVSILTNQHTIKDVILFPALKTESPKKSAKQDFEKKFVVIVNSKMKSWQLTNTIGHITAYLGHKMNDPFDTGTYFETKDGKLYPRNSQYAVVTLAASDKQLKDIVNQLRDTDLPYLAYLPEMITFGDDKKLASAISKKTDEEIKYCGVGVFGPKIQVDELIKGLELYK